MTDVTIPLLEVLAAKLSPTALSASEEATVLLSVAPGADTSMIWPRFAAWLLTDPWHGLLFHTHDAPSQQGSIHRIAELFMTKSTDDAAWRRAYDALDVANAVASPRWDFNFIDVESVANSDEACPMKPELVRIFAQAALLSQAEDHAEIAGIAAITLAAAEWALLSCDESDVHIILDAALDAVATAIAMMRGRSNYDGTAAVYRSWMEHNLGLLST